MQARLEQAAQAAADDLDTAALDRSRLLGRRAQHLTTRFETKKDRGRSTGVKEPCSRSGGASTSSPYHFTVSRTFHPDSLLGVHARNSTQVVQNYDPCRHQPV